MSFLRDLVGVELGPTSWIEITQDRIDAFAAATDDPQWIHVDVVRASEEPHEVGAHVRVVVDHQDPPRAGVVGQGGPRRGRRIAGVRQPPQRLRDRLGAQLRMVAGDPGGRHRLTRVPGDMVRWRRCPTSARSGS